MPNFKNEPRVSTNNNKSTLPSSSMTKSSSNLFSLPPPPPLNPKLKILKTLMSSKYNTTNIGSAAGKMKSTAEPETFDTSQNPNDTMILPTTPTLPPKLRTAKSKQVKVILPKTKKKANTVIPTKSNPAPGAEVSVNDSVFESLLLPSLKLSPAPGSTSLKGIQNDERPMFAEKQIYRAEEERAENPESLHLDKKGLKHFPLLGSEENNLKLLSLQHNSICRLENLPCLNHLLVLDLYNNRVERISGLQVFHSLRVLLLGKNRLEFKTIKYIFILILEMLVVIFNFICFTRIRRIEGLDGLKRLEILDLHGNQLRYIDNLTSLTSLRVLNLAGNLIRSIRNLGPYGLSALTELNLKRNRIKNLDGLHKAPHIRKLLLANNELQR